DAARIQEPEHRKPARIGMTVESRAILRPFRILAALTKSRGFIAMGKRSRSAIAAALVPAVLLGGVFAVVQAQNAGAPAANATKWSDPATWPNRQVPAAGDKVTIAKDKQVILDV